jgi:hypothetical protein
MQYVLGYWAGLGPGGMANISVAWSIPFQQWSGAAVQR